jgi:hypothetical protein
MQESANRHVLLQVLLSYLPTLIPYMLATLLTTKMSLLRCYEKYYPVDKLSSPLDQDPFFGPKIEVNKWLLLSL